MARPKKENARRKQFRIRMTEDEHRKLAAIADHMQMDMSDAIRELLEREWVNCFKSLEEYTAPSGWDIEDQEPCDDCISRRLAIVTAEQGQVQGYEWLFKQLCTMPSVIPVPNVGRWIPVSERLPEIHNYMQEYIVAIKGNFIRTAFFTETNGKSWWSIDDVIAWMPLPTPPKMSEIPTDSEGSEE